MKRDEIQINERKHKESIKKWAGVPKRGQYEESKRNSYCHSNQYQNSTPKDTKQLLDFSDKRQKTTHKMFQEDSWAQYHLEKAYLTVYGQPK